MFTERTQLNGVNVESVDNSTVLAMIRQLLQSDAELTLTVARAAVPAFMQRRQEMRHVCCGVIAAHVAQRHAGPANQPPRERHRKHASGAAVRAAAARRARAGAVQHPHHWQPRPQFARARAPWTC